MTAVSVSLAEFLEQRIAEDEEAAREELRVGIASRDTFLARQWLDVMRRLLAECEAKRRIVTMYKLAVHLDPPAAEALRAACVALASPHFGHPDFEDGWRR